MCAIRDGGSAECWGQARSLAPFVRNRMWEQIEVGPSTVCAVGVDASLACGGGNGMQLNYTKAFRVA
jgi:hypothetical protein